VRERLKSYRANREVTLTHVTTTAPPVHARCGPFLRPIAPTRLVRKCQGHNVRMFNAKNEFTKNYAWQTYAVELPYSRIHVCRSQHIVA
jgi:hypothetical protein